jgi:hypothetical protein
MDTKSIKRRALALANRESIIQNLENKIMVEKNRLDTFTALKPFDDEWMALHSQIKASKTLTRDRVDAGLESEEEVEEDSDGGEEQVDPLEARLLKL